MLDQDVQRAAIPAEDGDVGGCLAYRWVDAGLDAIAQGDHVAARDDRIGELALASSAENDPRSAGVVDAELALEAALRRTPPGELQHKRMDLEHDALDIFCA